jgi:hypothetical protein
MSSTTREPTARPVDRNAGVVEAWSLVLSGVCGAVSALAFVYERFRPRTVLSAVALFGGGLFAPLLFVFGVIFAAKNGRLGALATSVASGPLGFALGTTTGADYTGACFVSGNEETCTDVCCENVLDAKDRWRDCDGLCRSKKGVVGKNTGTSCRLDQSRKAYCNLSRLASVTSTNGFCNYSERGGPITCSCCRAVATTAAYWWDCDAKCNGAGVPGFKLNTPALCLEAKTNAYKCASGGTVSHQDVVDDKSDNQVL